MALAFAPYGKAVTITKINADEKVLRHLQNLGLTVGTSVMSLFDSNGDMILKVKDSRIALNRALAMKINVA